VFESAQPPILILGSHRSGTSAVASRLARMGLFLGARQDSHAESSFFQRLNRRLSYEAGGHWTNPTAVQTSLAQIEDLAAFASPVRRHLHSPAAAEYWGVAPKPDRLLGAWGWKDPRNTYLLPLWHAILPALRVVAIQRDPRDAARSLRLRAHQIRQALEVMPLAKASRRSLLGRPLLADGWRVLSADGALEVALSYREIQDATLRLPGAPDAHTVDYHQLVKDPRTVLQQCAAFCGLHPTDQHLEDVSKTVRDPAGERDSVVSASDNASVSVDHLRRLSLLGYNEVGDPA